MTEYWRWRYRDPKTGRICRTMFQRTADEASKYQEVARIKDSKLLQVDEPEGGDTTPGVFCRQKPE